MTIVEEELAMLKPSRNLDAARKQFEAFKKVQISYTKVTEQAAKKINEAKESTRLLSEI